MEMSEKQTEGKQPRKRRPLLVHQIREIANLIENEVAYFNGWAVSEATMRKNCEDAAVHILGHLRKRGLAKS